MTSPCPNPEICGSCSLSSLPYEEQLAKKLTEINAALGEGVGCSKILPSPMTSHYRNRMDFVINFEGAVGLREKGKWWRVIDNHQCFLGSKAISEAFPKIRQWVNGAGLTYFDRKKHHGFLRYAVVRSTLLGEIMVTIVTSAPASPEEEALAKDAFAKLCETLNPTTFIWSINHTTGDVSFGDEDRVLVGDGVLIEEIANTKFRVSPHAFFQTNSYASPLLVDEVKNACGDLTNKTLLDLYCGTGFFALAVGKSANKVIGVELNPGAVKDANANALLNNSSATFIDMKTEKYSWASLNPDVVILDPPRSGLHPDALQDVVKQLPPTIVYISCNYPRFAEELKTLGQFYSFEGSTAIDMFPHTPHVELVSKLTRKV